MQEKAGRQREISRPTGCPKLPHPTLANSPSQQETLLPTTGEKAKVPLEAKGIQPSPGTAPDMETQGSNVLGRAAGPTALLPRSRELTGRPCGLEAHMLGVGCRPLEDRLVEAAVRLAAPGGLSSALSAQAATGPPCHKAIVAPRIYGEMQPKMQRTAEAGTCL